MEWKVIKHIQSSNGDKESISCELWLDFPTTRWNEKKASPVMELYFYDRKTEAGWWIDKEKTEWCTYPPHKYCEVRFTYFQRQPSEKFYSTEKVPYNDFTLEYCQQRAIEILTSRLKDVISQCEKMYSSDQ